MVEERERACDEEVLRTGCEPADYAESILQVCRLYTESPLPCVSGVTGADVKKRLRAILTGTIAREWTAKQKIALATAGLTVFAVPVMIGAATPRFEAASVKLSPPGNRGNYRVVFTGGPGMVDPTLLRCVNMSLAGLIGQAYSSNSFQVKAPQWMEDQMFDISAKVRGLVSYSPLSLVASWTNVFMKAVRYAANDAMVSCGQYLPMRPLSWVQEDADSLKDALQEQLGLKLRTTLGPVDSLIVDHAEKLRTAN